jgi:hypothetical protein
LLPFLLGKQVTAGPGGDVVEALLGVRVAD